MSSPRSTTSYFFSLQAAVADALAGLEVELVAVPRADEMHLVGERLPLIGAVLGDHVDHLVDHDPLAGRPAGMDAVVTVGVIGAALVEDADLLASGDDDAAVAVVEIGGLGDEAFGHGRLLLDNHSIPGGPMGRGERPNPRWFSQPCRALL